MRATFLLTYHARMQALEPAHAAHAPIGKVAKGGGRREPVPPSIRAYAPAQRLVPAKLTAASRARLPISLPPAA